MMPCRYHHRQYGSFSRRLVTSEQEKKTDLQLGVDLFAGPCQTSRVLCHFETRDGYTTGIGSLSWSVPDPVTLLLLARSLKHINSFLGGAHVGALGSELAAGLDQCLGLLARDFILCGTGKSDIDVADVDPWACTVNVLELVLVLCTLRQLGEGLSLDLEIGNVVDDLGSDALALGGNNGTLAVGQGDNGGSELDGLECGVLCDVARPGNGDFLSLERLLATRGVLNHVLNVCEGCQCLPRKIRAPGEEGSDSQ